MSYYLILNEGVPDQKEKLWRYFNVFQTSLSMMMKRKPAYEVIAHLMYSESTESFLQEPFGIEPQEFINMTFKQFLDYRRQTGLFQHRFDFSSYWMEPDGRQVLMMFLPSKPGKDVDINVYNIFIAELIKINSQSQDPQVNPFRHFILLIEKKLGSAVQPRLKQYTNIRFEVYNDANFAFDVTEHCLSPISATLIPSVEVEAWSEKEGVTLKQLHNMYENDPFAIMYGARVGDVFVLKTMGVSHPVRIEYKAIVSTPRNTETPKTK